MRWEVVERMKHGTRCTCHLKLHDVQIVKDKDIIALCQKECSRCGNGTIANVRRGIVEEFLLVSRAGEGGDLKNQQSNRVGSSI